MKCLIAEANGKGQPQEKVVEKTIHHEKLIHENWKAVSLIDHLGVRNEPKADAESVAEYNKGDLVHFDGWLWADGFRWGTYMSYSGVRRYVKYGKIDGEDYMKW